MASTNRRQFVGALFGIAPDPTVVGTLGVLLAAERPHAALLVIPVARCAISGAPLWTMESPDAPLLPAIAALVVGRTAVKAWRQPFTARAPRGKR